MPEKTRSKSLTKKLIDKEDNWTLAELQEVIHWIRQALALVLGFVWGLIPLTGLASFIGYMVLSSATIMALYGNYLNIDEEEYGGHIGLLGEGLTPSFFLFLVRVRWIAWIVLFPRNPFSFTCMDFWLTFVSLTMYDPLQLTWTLTYTAIHF